MKTKSEVSKGQHVLVERAYGLVIKAGAYENHCYWLEKCRDTRIEGVPSKLVIGGIM